MNVREFGAVGDGVADDWGPITNAIEARKAAGGGEVYFPSGVYSVGRALMLEDGVSLRGDGFSSVLKQGRSDGGYILQNRGSLTGVEIRDLAFRGGEGNYPTDDRAANDTYPRDMAIYFVTGSGESFEWVTVRNCFFDGFSDSSVWVDSNDLRYLRILSNSFSRGAYARKVVYVGGRDGWRSKQHYVMIADNFLIENGPQRHLDASNEGYASSTDAIHLNRISSAVVSGNSIADVSGIGIRVEESRLVSVTGNSVVGSGASGIAFYKWCNNCTATGNVVSAWGRIPNSYCIRDYEGSLVVAREFPNAQDAPLPVDPTSSSWFEEWPYTLDGVVNVIPYRADDYYVGPSEGILPFRGDAAIAVTTDSVEVTVVGNTLLGDSGQANDFGVSFVHPVNRPTDENGVGSMVVGNVGAENVKQAQVWAPVYMDPDNENGGTGPVAVVQPGWDSDAGKVRS